MENTAALKQDREMAVQERYMIRKVKENPKKN